MEKEVFVIDTRTDLLGSFTQHVLFAKFYSNYKNKTLLINDISKLDNMSGFESQHKYISQYSKVSSDSKDDHIRYRKKVCSSLIKYHTGNYKSSSLKKNIGGTYDIQRKICEIGINKVINDKTKKNIRQDLLNNLSSTQINTNNLIAVHFRSGEIINMQNRYIHSSKYSKILENLRKQYPNHKIIIFTGNLPPSEHDDFATFKGYEIHTNTDVLELWTIFILADIFVVARSSFSHAPSLLRYNSQKTYYATFWHPKLESWNTWFPKYQVTNDKFILG